MPKGSRHLRISQDDILRVAGRAEHILDLLTHVTTTDEAAAVLQAAADWCRELATLQQRDKIIAEYHNAYKRKRPGE